MKINTKSWHYWLYCLGDGTPYHANLCTYFWTCVWGAFKLAFTATALVGFFTFLGILFYVHTLRMLSFTGGAACVLGTIFLFCNYLDRRDAGRRDQSPKEPGLIRSYLKAKKDKVCPMIEFD